VVDLCRSNIGWQLILLLSANGNKRQGPSRFEHWDCKTQRLYCFVR